MKHETSFSIYIAASILSGDFGRLAEEAKRIQEAGADEIHLDIMDGHFVPNLTFGPRAVEAIRRATDLFLDAHLMIDHPAQFIHPFVLAGVDRITFHVETAPHPKQIIEMVRKEGKEVGIACNPATSVEAVAPYIKDVDSLLLMTVVPGFGGQRFLEEVSKKIRCARRLCEEAHLKSRERPFLLQVDGGITGETARKCVESGANSLVSGSYLFSCERMADGIKTLRSISRYTEVD